MRLFIPFILGIAFVLYIAYLGIVKRELRQSLHTVVFPGIFFIAIWCVIYYFLMT